MKCSVSNGYAETGDIVTINSYGGNAMYRVTGFSEFNGKPQINYRRVIPSTLEFFPDTRESWMDFTEAMLELKLVRKVDRK